MGIGNVYIFPNFIAAEPGSTFKVDLRISGGRDVFAWQATLGWNSSVLNFVNATEGRFLKGIENNPTQWFNKTYQDQVGNDTITLGATRLGYVSGVDGSGILATIAFRVEVKGETPLYLTETILADSRPTPYPIEHTATDGLFSNIAPIPIAGFSITPSIPIIGETVIFDGSTSHDLDPEGTIDRYFWDFGDGSNFSATDTALASHAYSEGGTYEVALKVTNNRNYNNTLIQELKVRFTRDVAVISVTLSALSVTAGDKVTITVIAVNDGSETATFDVTVYYSLGLGESHGVAPAKEVSNLAMARNSTLTFEWDTGSVEPGDYKIEARAETLSGETYTTNNSKFGSEITVQAPTPFPWTMIIGAIAIVVVAGLGVFFFIRRRGKGKGPAEPI
jgi:PKD repeat protein